ncbi:hypothetical protein ACET3Z_019462 [Daucus carota]
MYANIKDVDYNTIRCMGNMANRPFWRTGLILNKFLICPVKVYSFCKTLQGWFYREHRLLTFFSYRKLEEAKEEEEEAALADYAEYSTPALGGTNQTADAVRSLPKKLLRICLTEKAKRREPSDLLFSIEEKQKQVVFEKNLSACGEF